MDPNHHNGLPFPARTDLELHQELHARPALPARAPCVVSYWVHADMAPERADGALAALCLSLGLAAPAPGVRHQVVQAPGYALKFERHGEFVSWQVNRTLQDVSEGADDATLRGLMQDASALTELPDAFIGQLAAADGGRMLAAAHVVMLQAHDSDDMLRRCQALLAAQAGPAGGDDAAPLMGAFIGDARRGALLTHLRLGRDGFTRFIVLDFGLPHDQAAREAQRLCEIEAYRMLAMQGFPVAQREAATLAELERTLQGTVDAMANDVSHDDAQAFETLTRLAADVEHGTARTRYRFSATRAYHAIVERRLADLREQRINGVQTLSGFLSRRFAPAMALCESIDGRLTDLGERINRATSLARVRIEVRREQGNQELLRALAQRQKQQLQLQQTVEGLSVVAISYYALGVIGYLAKGAKVLPGLESLHVQPDVVVGIAVVPVVAAVTWFVHRLRRHWSS
ncbi:DUF3422 domain-containing protein [Aquabacterium humicola]|uniref:DUF3422 domain-containing protein n=1 Tax=Aquabacterium humicola TaxID=3237377 RepID=UPI002542B402|nr:DUF3422 domain-containing protein [Rubrivivax pictus]